MSYGEELSKRLSKGEGVFDFLEGIFKSEENQSLSGKAGDGLCEGEEGAAPAEVFDRLVQSFKPQRTMEQRVESMGRSMEGNPDDPARPFKPFNALKFRIDERKRRNGTVYSGHYSPRRELFEEFYGLKYKLVNRENFPGDESLCHGPDFYGKCRILYKGEDVTGRIREDLMGTLFFRYVKELCRILPLSPWFAAIPKTLPFHFLLESAEESGGSRPVPFATLTLKDVAGKPLEKSFRNSCRPIETEPSEEQCLNFYAQYMDRPDSPEYEKFIDLCAAHKPSFLRFHRVGKEALEEKNYQLLQLLSPLFWRLVPLYERRVLSLQKKIFRLPLEEGKGEDYYDPQSNLLKETEAHLAMLQSALTSAPAPYREEAASLYEQRIGPFLSHEIPLLRLVSLEACGEDQSSPPSPSYFKALTESVSLIPKGNVRGEAWDFLKERLEKYGERAAGALPPLLELMEAGNRESLNEKLLAELAPLLYGLGLEEVPELVHRAHRNNPSFFTPYLNWCQKAPLRLLKEFLHDLEEDTAAFKTAGKWEDYLHNSPLGYEMFAEALEENEQLLNLMLSSLSTGAGTKLSTLLYTLADRAKREGHYSRMVAFLSYPEGLDKTHEKELQYGRIALLYQRMGQGEKDLHDEFNQLFRLCYRNATFIYLDSIYLLKTRGVQAGVERFITNAPMLCIDDREYREAYWEATRNRRKDFQPEPGYAYALLRAAQVHFEEKYPPRQPLPSLEDLFEGDPFYETLFSAYEGRRQERDRDFEDYYRVYEFLTDESGFNEQKLLNVLDSPHFPLALAGAERLVKKANREHSDALLSLLERVIDHDKWARKISLMLYESPVHKKALLRNGAFQDFLLTLIRS
ncbi:MAG: hypothetical protein PQJ60_08320 [Spirochaetales bacterium]|nr:hypothetical protein [Spirochaetales bacterium]